MAEKTVTILIDEKGNSEIDLEGFADNGCSKVFDEFRGRDKVKTEQKKSAFYTPQAAPNQVRTSR
jgi:hypothetical protein